LGSFYHDFNLRGQLYGNDIKLIAFDREKSKTSSSAIVEGSRCRVGQLWPKVEDCNWETVFYGHYRSVFNHCDVIGQPSNRMRRKKCKIRVLRRSRSFKVIAVGINGKPVCDFQLVIIVTDILSRTVSELSQLIVQILDTAFLSHPWGLGKTYDVHLGLIRKCVVDFLLLLNKLFSLDVTAEELGAKINGKSAISLKRGQFDPKF